MMATIKLKTSIKKCLVISVFSLLIWYLIFHKSGVSRSATWEPLPAVILHSSRTKDTEQLIMRTNSVPHIVHQTWKSKTIPETYRPWMKSVLEMNSDWEYWFWTDESMEEFMGKKYPGYLKLYNSYPAVGYKADAFRYFVLYEYGGVYVDLDMESVRPLEGYIRNHSCFLSQEPLTHAHFLSPVGIPLVSNAIMGCSPGHPFFADIIRGLPSKTGLWGWTDVLRATGPFMLTAAYKNYMGGFFQRTVDDPDYMHLASPDEFHPCWDNLMVDAMREMCLHSQGRTFLSDRYSTIQNQLCPAVIGYDFRCEPKSNSYMNHHWTHSWGGPRYDPWGVHDSPRSFDIHELLQD